MTKEQIAGEPQVQPAAQQTARSAEVRLKPSALQMARPECPLHRCMCKHGGLRCVHRRTLNSLHRRLAAGRYIFLCDECDRGAIVDGVLISLCRCDCEGCRLMDIEPQRTDWLELRRAPDASADWTLEAAAHDRQALQAMENRMESIDELTKSVARLSALEIDDEGAELVATVHAGELQALHTTAEEAMVESPKEEHLASSCAPQTSLVNAADVGHGVPGATSLEIAAAEAGVQGVPGVEYGATAQFRVAWRQCLCGGFGGDSGRICRYGCVEIEPNRWTVRCRKCLHTPVHHPCGCDCDGCAVPDVDTEAMTDVVPGSAPQTILVNAAADSVAQGVQKMTREQIAGEDQTLQAATEKAAKDLGLVAASVGQSRMRRMAKEQQSPSFVTQHHQQPITAEQATIATYHQHHHEPLESLDSHPLNRPHPQSSGSATGTSTVGAHGQPNLGSGLGSGNWTPPPPPPPVQPRVACRYAGLCLASSRECRCPGCTNHTVAPQLHYCMNCKPWLGCRCKCDVCRERRAFFFEGRRRARTARSA